jgi:hypothetical protein
LKDDMLAGLWSDVRGVSRLRERRGRNGRNSATAGVL